MRAPFEALLSLTASLAFVAAPAAGFATARFRFRSAAASVGARSRRGIDSATTTSAAPFDDDNDGGGRRAVEGRDRRAFLTAGVVASVAASSSSIPAALVALLGRPAPANAGIDPSLLKNVPLDGDASGAATRLKQIELERNRPEDSKDIAFEVLDSGVSYREYREGKGDAVVQPGSRVAVEMTVRCKSFATANEPGGLKYFSTKTDTDFDELAFTVGSGEILPGLEEGMMGMRRNAVRRIEVPSTLVFQARKDGKLPLPSEKNKDGKRLYDRLFKTDATLLFEVLVTRIK